MRLAARDLDLTAEAGARRLALGLLDEASAAARALTGGDPEALHAFRVALRRLRTALRAFTPWLGRLRRHRRRLGRLARATAAARDAAVQLAWIEARRGALTAPRVRAGVALELARLQARTAGPDRRRLRERHRRAARKLRRRLGPGPRGGGRARRPEERFGALLATLCRDQLLSLRRRMDAIAGPADEAGVHRARIEAKRLRYLLEPLRGPRRAGAHRAVEHLKRLQDVLGELHDLHVLAAGLRETLVAGEARRAVRMHRAVYAAAPPPAGRRPRPPSPRPGLLALLRLVRERRDALFAELGRAWGSAGLAALDGEVTAVAAAVAGQARPPARAAPARRRAPRPRAHITRPPSTSTVRPSK